MNGPASRTFRDDAGPIVFTLRLCKLNAQRAFVPLWDAGFDGNVALIVLRYAGPRAFAQEQDLPS